METRICKIPIPAITRPFRWKTMTGQVLSLDEMETSHIYQSMKMIFNHLAEAWGGDPVNFTRHHRVYQKVCREKPVAHAELVVMFLKEIDRRGDLPEKYWSDFEAIKCQIFQLALPPQSQAEIEEAKEQAQHQEDAAFDYDDEDDESYASPGDFY
jgi:hypothetical protein